jgi:predicted GIY-YIG superfamily endonuclease
MAFLQAAEKVWIEAIRALEAANRLDSDSFRSLFSRTVSLLLDTPPMFTHHRESSHTDIILNLRCHPEEVQAFSSRRPADEGSMHSRSYYVHIMTNRSKTLYTGITSNLPKRVWQHKPSAFPGLTSRYKLDRLVYHERFASLGAAIQREKPSGAR